MRRTHGDSTKSSPYYHLYFVYKAMIQRCTNPNNKDYKHYGKRGISVCPFWKDYTRFKGWAIIAGYKPNQKLTLDRKENNKGYSPSNCRWITHKENCNNKTNNVLLPFNGQELTIAEWADFFDVPYKTFHSRIRRSATIEEAFKYTISTTQTSKDGHYTTNIA